MPTDSIQLGATFIIAMGLIELLKFVIGKYTNKQGNGATEVLQRIQGNDLLHVNLGITEQNKILTHHTIQNETMIALLIEINTRLKLNSKE